jgi:hypothetical protein
MKKSKIKYKTLFSKWGYSLIKTHYSSHLFITDWGMTSITYNLRPRLKLIQTNSDVFIQEDGSIITENRWVD